MILPIIGYGNPVLKRKAEKISEKYPNLNNLIKDMWETMYNAKGVGLAAPQVGFSIRLFIVDTSPFSDDETMDDDEIEMINSFKKVMINPIIIKESGKEWDFNEGCLSIPDLRADIRRSEKIVIKYYDECFNLF